MRDGNKALQDWAVVVVCLRPLSQKVTLWQMRLRCLTGLYWEFVPIHKRVEIFSKYTCTYIVSSCCTAALTAEHYIWVWQAQAHITQTPPPVLHLTVFTSLPDPYPPWPPRLTLKEHWRFPVSFSNSLLCLYLSHTPQNLWRTIHFLVLTYMSPPPPPPPRLSLPPFIPSTYQLKWLQIRVVFLGFSFAKKKAARQARSCQSSSELTTRAGLGQINRTKLIIDFNHY